MLAFEGEGENLRRGLLEMRVLVKRRFVLVLYESVALAVYKFMAMKILQIRMDPVLLDLKVIVLQICFT